MSRSARRFLVIEGLDGSGQTTQVGLLAEKLRLAGFPVVTTKEPTDNLIGGLIRGVLTKEWKLSGPALQLLYAADRGHHLQRLIVPALKRGQVVISDRYLYSSLAYGSLKSSLAWLKQVNSQFIRPQSAFYLQVRPETALERIRRSRPESELFETRRVLEQVARVYEQLCRDGLLLSIDGERSVEKISQELFTRCQDILKKQTKG